MGAAQKLILLIVMFTASSGQAGWQATVNRMGFFGDFGFGAVYSWDNPHSVELSIGTYQINEVNYWQSNLAYRYSRWNLEYEKFNWVPIQLGVFTVRTWDQRRYFLESPSTYPYENYYDQTAFRWGFEFGSVVMKDRWAIAYHLRVLDTGLVAIYNNAHKDLQYHISSGLALRYHF